MDERLRIILETLLANVETLNGEILRMGRTEQFTPTTHCFQLVERIRGNCTCCLQNLRTIERRLYLRKSENERQAEIFPLNGGAS